MSEVTTLLRRFSVTVEEMSLQRSFEGLNGITYLMPPGNAFQRDGATYLKAYCFVLESLGLGTLRRDLEVDLGG